MPDRLNDSYYRATANGWETQRPLDYALDCDVVVIGGGFTGLSAALASALVHQVAMAGSLFPACVGRCGKSTRSLGESGQKLYSIWHGAQVRVCMTASSSMISHVI
jgi:hypothetical protein